MPLFLAFGGSGFPLSFIHSEIPFRFYFATAWSRSPQVGRVPFEGFSLHK
jgi:hypothetical protein